MAFVNGLVEIRVGNIDAGLHGPVPRQRMDDALNPHLSASGDGSRARVFDPQRDRLLVGALPAAKRLLRRAGLRIRLRDVRHRAPRAPGWQLAGVTLHDYQEEVVREALRRGCGLVDVGTGGGKTLLAAALIARLGLPALYLVTTRTLLAQVERELARLLSTTPGVIGEGTHRPELLTVALVQSLETGAIDLSPWSGGTLIFDEGHHAAATTHVELIRTIAPRYHYYLSAVPFRSGADQVVLDALAGAPLTGGRYAARYLIAHGYACPVEVRIERCPIHGEMREKPFTSLYREFIALNPERNAQVAAHAREAIAGHRSALVLVDHVMQGREIAALIGEEAVLAHGGMPKRALREAAAGFEARRVPCLIATAGLFAEGVSIRGIEVLIQAGGLRSRAKVIQSIGRGMRPAPGKSTCLYVDFWDDDEGGIFRTHSRERLRVLKEEGFAVPAAPERAALPEPAAEAIAPVWTPVPRRKRFLLIDDDGRVRGRGECLDRANVPPSFCRRCADPSVCERGGKITWQDDLA